MGDIDKNYSKYYKQIVKILPLEHNYQGSTNFGRNILIALSNGIIGILDSRSYKYVSIFSTKHKADLTDVTLVNNGNNS